MRRNDAYVSSKPLMTQLASTSLSPNAFLSAGSPAKSALRLYASSRFAMQKIAKRKYRRALEMCTCVPVAAAAGAAVGAGSSGIWGVIVRCDDGAGLDDAAGELSMVYRLGLGDYE